MIFRLDLILYIILCKNITFITEIWLNVSASRDDHNIVSTCYIFQIKPDTKWQRQQQQYQNHRQRWQLYRTTAHICQQWTAGSWILWERQPQHRLRDWEFTVKLPSRRKFATVFLYIVQHLRCFSAQLMALRLLQVHKFKWHSFCCLFSHRSELFVKWSQILRRQRSSNEIYLWSVLYTFLRENNWNCRNPELIAIHVRGKLHRQDPILGTEFCTYKIILYLINPESCSFLSYTIFPQTF